ncbi:MAG TPA: type II toxin-antitoxin system HicB family antitoxin [candidate division Zixibacteria bacterium]|nr:type II toxin-antitoxin system HicB family antitoxin [candidate division Zixibacteria bacterium]
MEKGVQAKHGRFTAIIEKDEDGFFVGTVPVLKSCYTQAKTMDELIDRLKEVIHLCLEEQEFSELEFVGVQTIEA